MEEYDDLDAFIDQQIHQELQKLILNEIGPYTCHLLKQGQGEDMKPFASGVMAELGGSCYILTASHVIEDWSDQNKLFLEVRNGNYISVVGKGVGTGIGKDTIDVAYIKLKPELSSLLKGWYKFLPIFRFLKHNKLLLEANYCVYGFPVSLSRKADGKLKSLGAAYYLKPLPDEVFEHYGFDFLAHYVLEFKGKAINIKTGIEEKIKIEHNGLSGGGLWYATVDFDGGKFISEAKLIGIMTEFRKAKYECLIANRIEIVLASLHQNEGLQFKKKGRPAKTGT